MEYKKLETAFILAGGKGIRMRRLGEYLPKCALVIYDQPLIIRQIESCLKVGIRNIVMSVSLRYEDLIRALLKPYEGKVRIDILVDHSMLGPIHAIFDAQTILQQRPWLFLLSDIYLEDDGFFEAAAARVSEHLTLINAFRIPDTKLIPSNCNIHLQDGRITRIVEKPAPSDIDGDLCWTGFSCHPSDFYENFDEPTKNRLIARGHAGALYDELLARRKGVDLIESTCNVLNITTPDDLLYASIVEVTKIARQRSGDTAPIDAIIRKIRGKID